MIYSSICDELSEVRTVCSETLKVDAHTELEIEAARTDDANNPDIRSLEFPLTHNLSHNTVYFIVCNNSNNKQLWFI